MTDMTISDGELERLESDVVSALTRRDNSELAIIGFGEVSVALGYPADEPRFICKRTPPFTPAQFEQYRLLVDRYVTELRAAGLSVVDTEVRSVQRGGATIAYLVQPLLDADTLGHRVLGDAEPDVEHPLLVALAGTLDLVSDRISIDAQATNWAWQDDRLTLLDVGTPFLWDASGTLDLDLTPYLPMIPLPMRSAAQKDLTKVITRWRERRGVAIDVVANLYREGLDQWIEPTVAAMNTVLDPGEVIGVDEAKAAYAEDLKTWPRLTKLKRAERAWQTRVRRRPYDFFIQSTVGTNSTF